LIENQGSNAQLLDLKPERYNYNDFQMTRDFEVCSALGNGPSVSLKVQVLKPSSKPMGKKVLKPLKDFVPPPTEELR